MKNFKRYFVAFILIFLILSACDELKEKTRYNLDSTSVDNVSDEAETLGYTP